MRSPDSLSRPRTLSSASRCSERPRWGAKCGRTGRVQKYTLVARLQAPPARDFVGCSQSHYLSLFSGPRKLSVSTTRISFLLHSLSQATSPTLALIGRATHCSYQQSNTAPLIDLAAATCWVQSMWCGEIGFSSHRRICSVECPLNASSPPASLARILRRQVYRGTRQ